MGARSAEQDWQPNTSQTFTRCSVYGHTIAHIGVQADIRDNVVRLVADGLISLGDLLLEGKVQSKGRWQQQGWRKAMVSF